MSPQYLTTESSDRLLTEGNDYLVAERSLPPYLGYNIFDLRLNWADQVRQRVLRSMTVLENRTGLQRVRTHVDTPISRFSVNLSLEGRAQIDEFRSWLRSFRGRQVPVWVPTWHRDLEHIGPIAGDEFDILNIGYHKWFWPHKARRHLALIQHDGTIAATIYVDNPPPSDEGDTENLRFNAEDFIDPPLDEEHTMTSFLLLCRPVTDRIKIEFYGHSYAEVRMTFVEVPREVPARS